MNEDRIKAFDESVKSASKLLKNFSSRRATIVHHNDADGVASGAVLRRGLEREGFAVEHIPLERLHPSYLPKIHTIDRKLILYSDLGASLEALIGQSKREESLVLILDHHPSFEPLASNIVHVNPEGFGIDGDRSCAAATVAYLFAQALNPQNEDLAFLAVLGALGDGQVVEGRMIGLNARALEEGRKQGSIEIQEDAENDSYRFKLFGGEGGMEVVRSLSSLSVNGYYRKMAEWAVEACLEGYRESHRKAIREMNELQEDRFERELQRLREGALSVEGEIQWMDVEDRFYPLGVKSIGTFCGLLRTWDRIDSSRYLLGFQNHPQENPYLGFLDEREVKASMRVPPALLHGVEKGLKPDLTEILPPAAREVGGFAEGCHRYSAACTIPWEKKKDLILSLSTRIREWERK